MSGGTVVDNPYQALYDALYQAFGPQHWWPADTLAELCVGAILTQNVSWSNVEKALERLRDAGLLSMAAIDRASPRVLAEAIRPAGYYNVKTRRLKALAHHVMEHYDGRLERLLDPSRAAPGLRHELLSINGVGPETADSLLVYGANKPAFIADAYGRRILARLGLIADGTSYEEARNAAQSAWTPCRTHRTTAGTWGELHALLVRLGEEYCTKRFPKCPGCPALGLCREGTPG